MPQPLRPKQWNYAMRHAVIACLWRKCCKCRKCRKALPQRPAVRQQPRRDEALVVADRREIAHQRHRGGRREGGSLRRVPAISIGAFRATGFIIGVPRSPRNATTQIPDPHRRGGQHGQWNASISVQVIKQLDIRSQRAGKRHRRLPACMRSTLHRWKAGTTFRAMA
eukprot:gene14591-biopygen2355